MTQPIRWSIRLGLCALFLWAGSAKLLDPTKVEIAKTYTTEFVKDAKVLP